MFTGLIQEKAKLLRSDRINEGGTKISVSKPLEWNDLKLGESIALDGVCLTLTEFSNDAMDFYVGAETLSKTTFVRLDSNQEFNLERSLRLGDRLGGHMVTGHVEGTAEVILVRDEPPCREIQIKLSPEQFKFVIPKGSLSLNGVSLTANSVDREKKTASFYLIPETLERTNLATLKTGDAVNVECDQFVKIIAHYAHNYAGETREYNL